MIDKTLSEMSEKNQSTLDALEKEFKKMRTGRASTSIFDGIKVDCYGTQMPLNQISSVSNPEARLLTIQPWDQSVIGDIEKSILKSGLGLTPMNDGKIIRVSIPPLTEERRADLAKMAKKMAEESKISVRNNRRDANDTLKKLKSESEISEDEMHKQQDNVQKITDEFIEQIEKIRSEKEKEILEF